MENRAQNNQTAVAVEVVPRLPIADKWHSYLQIDEPFTFEGDIDLSQIVINPDGTFTNGRHLGTGETLTGKIESIFFVDGPVLALHIDTDRNNVYEGVIVKDTAQRINIVGRFSFNTTKRTKPIPGLETQNEGVWVITKP